MCQFVHNKNHRGFDERRCFGLRHHDGAGQCQKLPVCTICEAYTVYPDATVDMETTFSPSGPTHHLWVSACNWLQALRMWSSMRVVRAPTIPTARQVPTSDVSPPRSMIWWRSKSTHRPTATIQGVLRELLLSNKEEGLTLTVQVDGKASFSLSHFDESKWMRRRQQPVENTHPLVRPRTQAPGVCSYRLLAAPGLGNNSCQGDVVEAKKTDKW